MPFMDGYEATHQIRTFLKKEGKLQIDEQPVISAVTGQTDKIYQEKCFTSGMN